MTKPKKWYQITWFSEHDTPTDRALILKLDLLIVPYAFLAYWTKYIDQANINNAYVSGLQTSLSLHGNDLIHLQTIYTVGAVLGQIPFAYLFTRFPMSWLIPAMDVAWGVFTLLQYRAQSYGELMAYRFLVGWFEAAFFPGMHYIFGSWYTPPEIARRGGIFYTGLTLGTLTASLIQAGTSSRLDGVHGLEGWRWMYIVCAVITIPIGVLGYVVLPGTVERPNTLVMKSEEVGKAAGRFRRYQERVLASQSEDGESGSGSSESQSVSQETQEETPKATVNWRTILLTLKSKLFWSLLLLTTLFWNASINTTTGGYLLWLKSLSRYSTAKLNTYAAISPALGIFYTLFICFLSDLLTGPIWAITLAHIWNIIGLVILVIWDVPEKALWFGFLTTYSAVSMSSVLYGWVNSVMMGRPAERAVVLVGVNVVAQSSTAWTSVLTFPTVEGPRFTKGYSFVLACAVALIGWAHFVGVLERRAARKIQRDGEEGEERIQVQTK